MTKLAFCPHNLIIVFLFTIFFCIILFNIKEISKEINNEIQDVDETELHQSIHEVMACNPFLSEQLEDDLKEIYKFLGAQAILAHRVFFEDHDENDLEYHHLAATLCQLHEALVAKLAPFAIEN